MRSHNDVARASSYGSGDGREPGADKPFPPCTCGQVTLSAADVAGLDDVAVAALLEARCVALLHRCPGWPERRREPTR